VARRIPEDRFHELIQAATAVFLEKGYQRTQMSDVADRLGVAKGTVYLYVESKEALFEAVLENADAADRLATPAKLPIATPRPGSTLRKLRSRLEAGGSLAALAAALGRRRVTDARGELEAIVRELYAMLSSHRIGIKLLDRCAADYPELASLWFGASGRMGLLALLERYLADRARRGVLRPQRDVSISARMVLETTVYWAVHRHWDASRQAFEESAVEASTVDFVAHALLGEESP